VTIVGIVGGGQLGLMTAEAARNLGIACRLLVRPSDESAVGAGLDVMIADEVNGESLLALAATVDVVTFDHEPVDLDAVAALEASGMGTYPGAKVLQFSDKAFQRDAFRSSGLPVPRYRIVDTSIDYSAIEQLGDDLGWPLVIKVPRGGYDGRGVWMADNVDDALDVLAPLSGRVVVEEALNLSSEISALIVRSRTGETAVFPIVDTVQRDGICHEVIAPSTLPPELVERARALAITVADVVGVVGVLAVELFVVGPDLLVNEVAPRPHNSGHLTIEACSMSQYELHLRAVLGQPLQDPTMVVEHGVMVNVLGDGSVGATAPMPSITEVGGDAVGDPRCFVHLYGKTPRAGRKVGHVTAIGADPGPLLAAAHAAAASAAIDGRSTDPDRNQERA